MDYLSPTDNAARQVVDSMTVFAAQRRVQVEAMTFAGGMYWQRQGKYE